MVCFTSAASAIQFIPLKRGDFKEIRVVFCRNLPDDLIFQLFFT